MKRPKKIIINKEHHQPSMHMVGKRERELVEQSIKVGFTVEQSKLATHSITKWLSEISVGSAFLYVTMSLARIAKFLFRLPSHSSSKACIHTENKPDQVKYSLKYAGTSLVIFILIASFYSVDYSLAEIKKDVSNHGTKGVTGLVKGVEYLSKGDKVRAQASFMSAEQSFDNGLNQLPQIPNWLRSVTSRVPYVNTIGSANDMFELAAEVSRLSFDIASLQSTDNNLDSIILTSNLLTHDQIELNEKIKSAIDRLSNIDPSTLPKQYADLLREAQSGVLLNLNHSLAEANDINIVLNTILGASDKQRFFLAFQNDREIRATGGFLGSFAIIDIANGEIHNLNVPPGGTYDVQGQQSANLTPPLALSLINSRWELQDANWWIDWPTSARQIKNMYESAGGSSVDGVIAIDTSILEEFIEITGPIELTEYNLILTSENVVDVTQYHVEVGYDPTIEKPKQIIATLTPLLIERIQAKAKSDPAYIAGVLLEALKEKKIQVYATDNQTSSALTRLGWDGALGYKTGSDSLAIVHSNIAGQKTDAVMRNSVDYEINIDDNGVARARLIITRQHNGIKGDDFTGVRNVDYIRVYVPEGSELISAQGFNQPDNYFFDAPQINSEIPKGLIPETKAEIDRSSKTLIYDELNHTVFANWLMTDPGQTSIGVLNYRLPNRFMTESTTNSWFNFLSQKETKPRYEFNWTQQSGLDEVNFTHSLHSDDVQSIVSSRPLETHSSGWVWKTVLNKDINLIVDIN